MEYPGYRKMEMRELQLLQVQVMKRIHDFCVSNDIKYYMICGTFLGAIRHKGFIPWDDDMDIALMREDYNKFVELFPSYFNDGSLTAHRSEDILHYYPGHGRVFIANTLKSQPGFRHYKEYNEQMYIDIFPLDVVPLEMEKRKVQEFEIKKMTKIINRKVYRIYPTNGIFKILAKKIISMFCSRKSLYILQMERNAIMTRYNGMNTGLVSSMASHYSYTKQTMNISIYGTPTLYEFEGELFYGPENWRDYLVQLYGEDYMKLPPIEKRIKPHDNFVKV